MEEGEITGRHKKVRSHDIVEDSYYVVHVVITLGSH